MEHMSGYIIHQLGKDSFQLTFMNGADKVWCVLDRQQLEDVGNTLLQTAKEAPSRFRTSKKSSKAEKQLLALTRGPRKRK